LLPAPAGEWTFPTLSPQSLQRRLDPYPAAFLRCSFPFLPEGHRPHVRSETFGTLIDSCIAASAGHVFRGCSHSFMFRLPYSLGPQTAPTAPLLRWAAGPFTPRVDHAVTRPDLWYRYMPESGNWHGGTFTRWTAALSAAPRPVRAALPHTVLASGSDAEAHQRIRVAYTGEWEPPVHETFHPFPEGLGSR
jgi:hypothetical protein